MDTSVEDLDISIEEVDTSVEELDISIEEVDNSVQEVDISVQDVDNSVQEVDISFQEVDNAVQEVNISVQEENISVKEELNTAIIEEIKMEVCEVEDKLVSDLIKHYPHDLQMYKNPVTGQISLNDLEILGVERLAVLRIIEYLSKEMDIKPEEFKECLVSALRNKGFDSYVKLIMSPGCDSNTFADVEARRRDHISHCILKLALCRKSKTLDWFVEIEDKLFHLRFGSLNENGLEKFLILNDINFATLSEEEKNENRENLLVVYADVDFDNTAFYKVSYLSVRNLVENRKVFLKEGIAFLPPTEIIHVISQTYRDFLYEENEYLKNMALNEPRFRPIIKKLSILTKEILLDQTGSIDAHSLEEFAQTSYPLCMKTMHEALRSEHHLKNNARFQYGMFLKILGLSYDSAVDFWKEEFLKRMDETTFNQRYLYNIKYIYGKVGQKANYKYLSCNTIIKSRVGFGEYHGCPYKNMTLDTLQLNLEKIGLKDEGIVEIEDLVKNERFTEACSQCFHQVHKTYLPEVVISPAYYFLNSRNVILHKKHIEDKNNRSLLEQTEANKENSCLDISVNDSLTK